MTKRRITVTVDEDLIEAASDAVSDGDASSVSAWVNEAMAAKREEQRLLDALDEALADYESEFGPITDEQVEEARRLASQRAIRVRARTRELSLSGEPAA
ncbi:hypothetical protein [Candidatus Poriferisodalis sp.]|uniref:hypothetical protein n=1 Tax=Candidatus Poriferisodalis sp. TaxID=3101277 RepID=UPI003D13C6D3